MTVQELITSLEKYRDQIPVIIMTPEKNHHLTYRITEVSYDNKLNMVIIDVQRSGGVIND